MDVSSKYWKICRIGLSSKKGYECSTVPLAQAFWQQQALNSQKANIQTTLNAYFYERNATIEAKDRAVAGLCLRCYVSYSILKACQTLDNLFGGANFTYQDLLPFVLNDDGKSLRIIDPDGKTQLALNNQEVTAPSTYPLFTLEIL